MAMSLGFHILFAVAGIAMPLFMVLAEWRWRRTGDETYRVLAKRWSKGVAILFAVGAVSGTVLSFELGLLWPNFMEFAGPIIGMPFSLEGFAFFLEAIFLGVYLYGWDRVSPRLHLASGVGVLICGTLSGAFVVCANAWMNAPVGFELNPDGSVLSVDVWAAMFNPAMPTQVLHMTLAAFQSVAFAVAGLHAWRLLKSPGHRFHLAALRLVLPVAVVTAFLQPISGDLAAKHLAHHQPVKFAAMEALWDTQAGAPLTIGGWPDEAARETHLAIEIPYALSFLGHADFQAEITGLNDIDPSLWPPIAIVHVAFQIMVGAGMAMLAVGALVAFRAWRVRGLPTDPWLLKLLVAVSPLGLIALEAGWTVTEVGRQPWVVRGFLRTADAVTPMPHLAVPFLAFTALYAVLGLVVVAMLRRHVFAVPEDVPHA